MKNKKIRKKVQKLNLRKWYFFKSNQFFKNYQFFKNFFFVFFFYKWLRLQGARENINFSKFGKLKYKSKRSRRRKLFRIRLIKEKRLFFKHFIKKKYFRRFKSIKILNTFVFMWVFRKEKSSNIADIKKFNIINFIALNNTNILIELKNKIENFIFFYTHKSIEFFYLFLKSMKFKYALSSFAVSSIKSDVMVLFNIKIKNLKVLKFNFRVYKFETLVRIDDLSLKYKSSFKVSKRLTVNRFKKKIFILKIAHIRWIQTHLNFILNVTSTLFFPKFIFLGKKYLKKLSFFSTIFREYWLAKYLFYTKNNRRWIKFFKQFGPNQYFKKIGSYRFKSLLNLNSTHFNWFLKTQKVVLLKYYYLVKYSKLSFFFFFYLKLLWSNIFNSGIVFVARRLKFSKKIKRLINKLYYQFKVFESRLKPSFFLYEAIEVLFLTFNTKNSYFFHKWMCEKIGKIFYKKHFKILNFISSLIRKNFKFFQKLYQIKGVQYIVKGKINMKGSVRKRKSTFQIGEVSYSDTSILNCNNFNIARTDTGALGIFFLVSY